MSEVKITPNGIKQAIDGLLNENELLQDMDKILRNENTNLKLEIQRLNNIINKANDYNEHLIRDAKYHLNKGHLKKMKKILNGDGYGRIC